MSRLNIFKIVLNLTILSMAIVGQVRLAWVNARRDPIDSLDAVCPFLRMQVTWLKLICFLIYRKDLQSILKSLFQHCKADTTDSRKSNTISRVSYFATIWVIGVFLNSFIVSFLFSLKPVLVWIFQFVKTGNSSTWVSLPFQVALPYEDMTRISNKGLYSLIYVILAHSGTLTVCGVGGADGTFLYFCMYISGSYQCLQQDFVKAFKEHTSKGPSNDDVLYNEIKRLIRRQKNIIELFSNLNRIFKIMILIHFASASIILAIVFVNLLLTSGISTLIYVNYALSNCIQLLTYCFGAEQVDKNCIKMGEMLYFCEWYKCSQRVKVLVLFALMKSQKGNRMKVPFFSPSMELYASMIQKSVSYFTVLRTIL